MKTREDVDKLKADWKEDPCWDIEETEGFEEYREELHDFSVKHKIESEEKWQKRKEQILKDAKVSCVSDLSDLRYDGLTKRELFAAMVMQGMLSNWRINVDKDTARLSVVLADELINELNKEE